MKQRSRITQTPIRETTRLPRDARRTEIMTDSVKDLPKVTELSKETDLNARVIALMEKVVLIRMVVRVIGVITMLVALVRKTLVIRSAVADQMQDRVINSETNLQLKTLRLKLRAKTLQSIEKMKNVVSAVRTKINVPKRT